MKGKSPVEYSEYLMLDRLLSSQSPKSAEYGKPAHDETLFIIVHQTYELWFKQILHELDSVIAMFREDYVSGDSVNKAVARLERVTRIQRVLIDQLRVLETMTPLDFLDFRDLLIPASGFQSVQFRLIEKRLGLRRKRMSENEHYHAHFSKQHTHEIKKSDLDGWSLLDVTEKWLERVPFLQFEDFDFWSSYRDAVKKMLDEDRETICSNPILSAEDKKEQLAELEKTEISFAALFDEKKHDELVGKGQRRLSYKATKAALLIHLYRDQPILQMPFQYLTQLVDIDELMAAWRHRHALMVHRMIGTKIGTGGTSGHQYLRMTIEKCKVFTDLFNISTFLIPRSALMDLPEKVKQKLGFYHQR